MAWSRRWLFRTLVAALFAIAGIGGSAAQDDRLSMGTGFIVSSDGAIITAAHGVDGCRSLTVAPSGAPPVETTEINVDKSVDLALLKTKLSGPIHPLPLRNDPAPRVGEPVYLLGYPLQRPLLPGHPSFFEAVVAGMGGLRGDPQVFRLSILVLPGMSGAPVLDARGRVIGIIKTHLIETLPNGGPTVGGESFAILGTMLAKFGLESGSLRGSGNEPIMPPVEIAARALAGTVLITCHKGEAK